MNQFNNISEIREAINNGITVYWTNGAYTVTINKFDNGIYIKCNSNGHMTGTEENKLIPSDFFTLNK